MIIARFYRASEPIDCPPLLPLEDGVWSTKLTSPSVPSYWSAWGTDSTLNTTPIPSIVALSVFANNTTTKYGEVSSLNDCKTAPGLYYYDAINQLLYINLDGINAESALILASTSGSSTGFSTDETLYINNVEYPPYLKSIPSVHKSVDPLKSSRMSFENQTIDLINSTGELDPYISEPIPGVTFDLAYYDQASGNQFPVYSGYVTSDEYALETASFKVTDIREKYSVSCPTQTFSATSYPYIEDKQVGKIIPEIYGTVRGAECVCLNANESASYYTFRPCLTMTTLSAVYVQTDNDKWTAATVYSSNLSGGTFTLASSVCKNSNGKIMKVKANLTGRNIHNAAEIIKDLNSRYGSITYNQTNYDIATWEAEAALITGSCYLYMDEQLDLYEWIEELQNASIKQFIYDINPNGLRTLRVYNADRAESFTLDSWQLLDYSGARDFEYYASRVNIEYARDFSDDFALTVFNNDYETSRAQEYGKLQNYTLESKHAGLDNITDADAKADDIAEKYSPQMVFTAKLFVDDPNMFNQIQLFSTGTINFANIEPVRCAEGLINLLDSDGLYLQDSNGLFLIGLGCDVAYTTLRESFGQRRVMVEAFDYDLSSSTLTIKARERNKYA